MVSQDILLYMGGSSHRTSDIEAYGRSLGYSQRQVLGGIGYLRSQGVLNIVSTIIMPNGRKEHLFR